MNREDIFNAIKAKRSFLCVGLDSDPDRIPEFLKTEDDPLFAFNKAIIDATKDLVIAYKPNTAFYEALGPKGMVSLKKTIAYIPKDILCIADAKRGDIGNTSRMYAKSFFEYYNADAITVAPYMGSDSVMPFMEYEDKWVIVLALTSNKGSSDFQYLKMEGQQELFKEVLHKVSLYGTEDNLMFVVGATQAEKLSEIRKIIPHHFLLVPGVGAQGGDLQAVCQFGLNDKVGLIVNSSRSIIFASNGRDFAERARIKAMDLRDQMASILSQRLL